MRSPCSDTSSPVFQREYKKYLDSMVTQRTIELRRSAGDTIPMRTDSDLVTPLLQFFHRRSRR